MLVLMSTGTYAVATCLLTLILYLPHSAASVLVKLRTAPLEVL